MTPHKCDDDSLSPAEMACREEVIKAITTLTVKFENMSESFERYAASTNKKITDIGEEVEFRLDQLRTKELDPLRIALFGNGKPGIMEQMRTISARWAAGEKIQIQVLNADGSQSSLVCDETVPPGQKFVGNVSCVGILSQA